MKLKFIQGCKNESQQQGFSMLETLMASMISLVFLSLGANLILAANMHKIVAKTNIAMNNFIQSDLEGVKYQANLLTKDNDKCNPTDVTNGYAGVLKTKLGVTTPVNLTTSNRNYTMTRTIGTITNSRILPISYVFTRNPTPLGQAPEHQLYIEMIPNAAFTCPSTT